ncbi:MAG: type II secretion system minor pseudopilin GspK [Roseibium album]|uniref:type II secretion system minor pseudopilin GspK n=1 Tax=Roseibium album TaxID=311410 RepID=UPI0032EC4423
MAGAGLVSARRQTGVVLLTVLLVLALLSAIAWQLMGRHSLVIAQARYTFTGDQSLEYALGAETFARQVLFEEWSQGGAGKDTLQEVWAQPVAPFEVDNGFLEIQVRDMHGCFNLNSLAGSQWQQNLERLRNLLRNRNVPESLAEAWRDWVDPDQEITGFGAEDGDYLLEDPAYRTADRSAADVSEFRLLRGIEQDHLDALEGALCVLPSTDLSVNVNTADAAVLAALSPGLSEPQMQAFAEAVRDYDNVSEVVTEFPDLTGAVDALSVTSQYFRVDVRARVDDGQTELSSLLRREPSSGAIELISRDFGRNFRSLFAAEDDEDDNP